MRLDKGVGEWHAKSDELIEYNNQTERIGWLEV